MDEGSWRNPRRGLESVGCCPVVDGMLVFQQWVQDFLVGSWKLGVGMPDSPAFIMNFMGGWEECGVVGAEDIPICLSEVVHLVVELFLSG